MMSGEAMAIEYFESENDTERYLKHNLPLTERLLPLLTSGKFTDVQFKVGAEEEDYFGHQAILAAGSVVFESLFNKHDLDKPIVLIDVEPFEFAAILHYLYSDDIPDPNKEGDEVGGLIRYLHGAHKFKLDKLQKFCSEKLKKQIKNEENALQILEYARQYSQAQLEESCWKVITEKIRKVITSERFTELNYDVLCDLLANDQLEVKEFDLFQATVNWAKAECKRRGLNPEVPQELRKVLGRALQLIGFPIMTPRQFSDNVVPLNLLTDKEMLSIYQCFSGCPPEDIPFPRSIRSGKKDKRIQNNTIESVNLESDDDVTETEKNDAMQPKIVLKKEKTSPESSSTPRQQNERGRTLRERKRVADTPPQPSSSKKRK